MAATRLIMVTTVDDDRFQILVSTKIDDRVPDVEGKTVPAQDVVKTIESYDQRYVSTKISLDGGPSRYPHEFAFDFNLIREHEWVTSDEFYANAEKTGRYGGETDFGCFWRVTGRDQRDGFDVYTRARVTWIENTGEIYAYASGRYLLLGRTRAGDREYIESVLEGWADACMAAESLHWIRRALGIMARSYRDDRDAMRAYGALHGYEGAPGGWIYRNGNMRPVGQGWWSAVGRTLDAYGGMIRSDRSNRTRIVDTRSLSEQAMRPMRRAV